MAAAAAITGKLTDVRTLDRPEDASSEGKVTSWEEFVGTTPPPPAPAFTTSSSAATTKESGAASGGAGMPPFTTLQGVVAPFDVQNVDTDMIIPKQYLKTIKRTGLAKGLFHASRYKADGSEEPDFVLNKEVYRNAKILVCGDNFGCGSSREHAPWAILDFGIRCMISTSFADIFYNNCFKNGMLPIKLPATEVAQLMADAQALKEFKVDLPAQQITRADGSTISFEVEAFRKHCLVNGLDDIGLTLQKSKLIDAFESKRSERCPWLDGAGYRDKLADGPRKLAPLESAAGKDKRGKVDKVPDW